MKSMIIKNDMTRLRFAQELGQIFADLESIYKKDGMDNLLKNYFQITREDIHNLDVNRDKFRQLIEFHSAEKNGRTDSKNAYYEQ